ncbi:MAG: hypothetical protein H0X33_06070 [Taibaiella sp.]|nr:hypothetical protein [Taibaiella sp.]
MKWMPFTPASHQQLMNEGYTHIIVKKKVSCTQLWLNNRKDLQFLEASRAEQEPYNNCAPISSPIVSDLFKNDHTDYYVVVR